MTIGLNTENFTDLYLYYRVTVHVIIVFHMNYSRQYGWLKCQINCFLPAITASKGTKTPTVKVQGIEGSQVDYPTAVSQNIDVDTVKYTFTLNKI